MKSRKSSLRTADVAGRSGYSVQQIRNLERDGVLPRATRTASGYRTHTDAHVHAALAYRAFTAAVGPATARQIVRAAHDDPDARFPALLDAAHAQLHTERHDLDLAVDAAAAIADEPIVDVRQSDSMTITELARALGLPASTLRHWEAEGLVSPGRTARDRTRVYTPRDVRDARIVHQLRRAGYRIPALRAVLPELRRSGTSAEIEHGLRARRTALDERSRRLVDGVAELRAMQCDQPKRPEM